MFYLYTVGNDHVLRPTRDKQGCHLAFANAQIAVDRSHHESAVRKESVVVRDRLIDRDPTVTLTEVVSSTRPLNIEIAVSHGRDPETGSYEWTLGLFADHRFDEDRREAAQAFITERHSKFFAELSRDFAARFK